MFALCHDIAFFIVQKHLFKFELDQNSLFIHIACSLALLPHNLFWIHLQSTSSS